MDKLISDLIQEFEAMSQVIGGFVVFDDDRDIVRRTGKIVEYALADHEIAVHACVEFDKEAPESAEEDRYASEGINGAIAPVLLSVLRGGVIEEVG